jgi:hypothetical protein
MPKDEDLGRQRSSDRNNPTNAVQIRLKASFIGQKDCVIPPQLSARLGLRQGQRLTLMTVFLHLASSSTFGRSAQGCHCACGGAGGTRGRAGVAFKTITDRRRRDGASCAVTTN